MPAKDRLKALTYVFEANGYGDKDKPKSSIEPTEEEIADEIILVADHTKFGKRSVVKLCDLEQVDVIVTDAGADERTRGFLGGLKAKVIYA